jgi:two-component system, LytTR family, sensor kinase
MAVETRSLPLVPAKPVSHQVSRLMDGPTSWLAGFAIWTVLGLLSALQTVIFLNSINEAIDWGPVLVSRMADWYTCALFTPVYFWLVRRYPIDRGHWKIGIPLHLITTSLFVVLKYALLLQSLRVVYPDAPARTLEDTLARSFIIESIAFWCVLGVVHAIVFYERYRDREIQAAELKARLSAAQLESLAAQLHPHFLFNTLQGVSTLMHRDPVGADTMLNRLSELLRRTLHRGARQEVRLRDEMELLGHYVGIMQVRFGDRLIFDTSIDDSVADAMVPHFILQPLVENALQHGIARRAGRGRVLVEAVRQGDAILLSVSDDGPGLASAPSGFPANGIGLNNTRLRLEQLYGDRQRLTLAPIPTGGMRVELVLPFREEKE